MVNLIENEVIKVFYKKRLHVIVGILIVLIGLFAYGEHYTLSRTLDRVESQIGLDGEQSWQQIASQQKNDLERRLDNPYIPDEGKASIRVQIEQLNFYLENDINPINSTAARFMGRFVEQSVFLFLPLLVILLAGDMVSGEMTSGTIKLILTRAVPRWKIFMSKFLALMVLEMLVMMIIALISFGISMAVFDVAGFKEPVVTGFKVIGDTLDVSGVRTIEQWQYLLMVFSLAYFIAFVIGAIALMVSVLVKSTSASIGIMMSTLIGGSLLTFFIAEWDITRYFFTVNLNLTAFITGSFQRFEGLSMLFSTLVLLGWAVTSTILGFLVFIHKDMLA